MIQLETNCMVEMPPGGSDEKTATLNELRLSCFLTIDSRRPGPGIPTRNFLGRFPHVSLLCELSKLRFQ